MEFGYFTLSDNHYDNNPRGANQFVADITAEALYADDARHAFGLDRRASLQFARRPLLPRPGAGRTWRHRQSTSGWRRRSPCCRCIIRSGSRSNGRRSTFSATAASISPPDVATTSANTIRSTSPSPTTRASSRKASSWCAGCGRPTTASRTKASTIRSRTCASRPNPCRSRSRPMWLPSRSPRSSLRRGLAAD